MNTSSIAVAAPAETTAQRLARLMGRLRAKQLELAQRGRTCASARYAERAKRVRRALAVTT